MHGSYSAVTLLNEVMARNVISEKYMGKKMEEEQQQKMDADAAAELRTCASEEVEKTS